MLSIISHNRKYDLAMFLQPYLPLIKSRVLYQLYDNLRYERQMDYSNIVCLLEEEAIQDYRLQRLLDRWVERFKNDSA
jgi:hypothetical protein